MTDLQSRMIDSLKAYADAETDAERHAATKEMGLVVGDAQASEVELIADPLRQELEQVREQNKLLRSTLRGLLKGEDNDDD